jgi:hypothetical protein
MTESNTAGYRYRILHQMNHQLDDALGIREVSYTKGQQALALKEQKLQRSLKERKLL